MTRKNYGRPRSARTAPAPQDLADALFGEVTEDRPDRKLDPFLAQIADAIAMALATARDPVLQDLTVATVEPRRGSASVRVVLHAAPGVELAIAAEHAARAVGYLRAEVAAAIQRKRTPDLVVEVIQP